MCWSGGILKKEMIEAVIFEHDQGKESRDYNGRFIGVVDEEETSAIVNNPILHKRLTHMETKKLALLGAYSDADISNKRAVIVANKIGSRDVTKFLYFTELLDSVVHSNEYSAHLLTKNDGYIMFSAVDRDGNYVTGN